MVVTSSRFYSYKTYYICATVSANKRLLSEIWKSYVSQSAFLIYLEETLWLSETSFALYGHSILKSNSIKNFPFLRFQCDRIVSEKNSNLLLVSHWLVLFPKTYYILTSASSGTFLYGSCSTLRSRFCLLVSEDSLVDFSQSVFRLKKPIMAIPIHSFRNSYHPLC